MCLWSIFNQAGSTEQPQEIFYTWVVGVYTDEHVPPKRRTSTTEGADSVHKDAEQSAADPEPCAWVNAVLTFLFKELQYTVPVHQHFRDMIESDLKELREETVAGKLIERTAIVDMHLGNGMPHFSNAAVTSSSSNGSSDPATMKHDSYV